VDAQVIHVAGKRLYYGSEKGIVGCVDLSTLKPSCAPKRVSDNGIQGIASSADSQRVYITSNDDLVAVMTPDGNLELLAGTSEHVTAVAVGRSSVFAGGKHGSLRTYAI
jgi:hypothetical protein